MKPSRRSYAFTGLLLLLALETLATPADAQLRGPGRRGVNDQTLEAATRPEAVERRSGDVSATGLKAVFPEEQVCPPIASPFASPYRYDGSSRRDDRFGGLHGGIDITLQEGTPLLAVAGATVIAKGQGGHLEGIFLWLMHAPEDTGLPFWTFTKYQHLSDLPALNEGDRVRVGQEIASSGKTGTVGGHYGAAGYPHLHLSLTAGPSNNFQRIGAFGSMIKARDAVLSDPLILYLPGLQQPTSGAALPADQKSVRIPVVGVDGNVVPIWSKVVWPVVCRPVR